MGAAVQASGGGGGNERRGRRGRRRGKYRAMSEIMPETAAETLPVENEEPLTVTLTAEGALMIQTTETPPDELIGKLTAIAAERNSDKIFLRADGAIPYEQVMQVMGALNAGGFRNIGLVTDSGGPRLNGEEN